MVGRVSRTCYFHRVLPGVHLLIFNEVGFQMEDSHHFCYICSASSPCIVAFADNQRGRALGKRVPTFITLTEFPRDI